MNIHEMEKEVLERISIPDYIYEIVLPNMQDYYNGDFEVNFDNSRYMKCCFHNEDTPSLRWYEETNTYYCFGCGKGGRGYMGTVVGFHMNFVEKMNGSKISKNDAIVFLHRYFIQQREVRSSISKPVEKTKVNNQIDISSFAIFRNDIEKSLLQDRIITKEKAQEIYDTLDNIDLMLVKDLISVRSARAKVEQIIAEL